MTELATRRVALIVIGVILAVTVAAGLAVTLIMLVTRDTRQDINLAEFAHTGVDVPALHGYRNATDELCSDVDGCVQGYSADHAAYRKFATTDAAEAFASSSPNTYRSNWIVIEYTDNQLPEIYREDVQSYIDSIATSD